MACCSTASNEPGCHRFLQKFGRVSLKIVGITLYYDCALDILMSNHVRWVIWRWMHMNAANTYRCWYSPNYGIATVQVCRTTHPLWVVMVMVYCSCCGHCMSYLHLLGASAPLHSCEFFTCKYVRVCAHDLNIGVAVHRKLLGRVFNDRDSKSWRQIQITLERTTKSANFQLSACTVCTLLCFWTFSASQFVYHATVFKMFIFSHCDDILPVSSPKNSYALSNSITLWETVAYVP